MIEVRRRVLLESRKKKRLPNEYQEVEYIESDGAQYIDTGILPSSTDVYSFKGEFPSKNNSVLFGCRSSGTYLSGNQLYLNRNLDRTFKIVMLVVNTANNRDAEYTKNVFFYSGDDLPLEIDEENISINGRTSESFNPTQPIYLFGFNVLGTNNKTVGGGKLVYFKIDGRCNFIPCYRKSDGEIGMYDLVGEQFYVNSGTGVFSKGNDVN